MVLTFCLALAMYRNVTSSYLPGDSFCPVIHKFSHQKNWDLNRTLFQNFFFWCNYLKSEKSRENKKFNLVFSLQNGFGVFFRVTVFITSGEEAGVVGGDLSVVWIFLK